MKKKDFLIFTLQYASVDTIGLWIIIKSSLPLGMHLKSRQCTFCEETTWDRIAGRLEPASSPFRRVIQDIIEISIPSVITLKASFTLILLMYISNSVSSAYECPPPVFFAADNLSLMIGVCFTRTLDHFL